MTHGKVVDPAAEDRIDPFDQFGRGLGASATELEPQEPEALPFAQIHDTGLLVVHLNLDLG
jgi:hypothetical protein